MRKLRHTVTATLPEIAATLGLAHAILNEVEVHVSCGKTSSGLKLVDRKGSSELAISKGDDLLFPEGVGSFRLRAASIAGSTLTRELRESMWAIRRLVLGKQTTDFEQQVREHLIFSATDGMKLLSSGIYVVTHNWNEIPDEVVAELLDYVLDSMVLDNLDKVLSSSLVIDKTLITRLSGGEDHISKVGLSATRRQRYSVIVTDDEVVVTARMAAPELESAVFRATGDDRWSIREVQTVFGVAAIGRSRTSLNPVELSRGISQY